MPYLRSALAAWFLISLPSVASAKTWVNGQPTPDVEELVVVDATGESHWVFGKEDLAGDGETFGPAEASADVRTAYAAADATRFWARAYVSSEAAPASDIIVYVFVDTDQNVLTGGSSAATEIDPRFTFDTGGGGFEHCFAFRGNGTMGGLWHYSEVTNAFQPENLVQSEAVAEVGTDSDPILLGSVVHGYLQGAIDHDKIGTTAGCQARLYFRSLDATGSGPSDEEVGDGRPCVPADVNNDGIPDVLAPTDNCATDEDCPFFGICDSARCIVADPCDDDSNCPADRACEDGRCVLAPSNPCGTTDNCNSGMLCQDGTCVACASHAECGEGGRCSPDGQCLVMGAGALGSGEAADDGCGCGVAGGLGSVRLAGLAALAIAVGVVRRRRAKGRTSSARSSE